MHRDIKAPIVLQVSQGGSAFFAGKGLANDKQQASITGAIAAAHHIRTVAKSYGVCVQALPFHIPIAVLKPYSQSSRVAQRPLCQETSPLVRWHARSRRRILQSTPGTSILLAHA